MPAQKTTTATDAQTTDASGTTFVEPKGTETDQPPFDTDAGVTDPEVEDDDTDEDDATTPAAVKEAKKVRRAAWNLAETTYKDAVASHRAAIEAARKTRDAARRAAQFAYDMAADPDAVAEMAAMFEAWRATQPASPASE
jgi:hypothetical protein